MVCELVGGPRDGERIAVPDGQTAIEVQSLAQPARTVWLMDGAADASSRPEIDRGRYEYTGPPGDIPSDIVYLDWQGWDA